MKIYLRFLGFLKKALTLSYDDGVDTDIKMIDILNRHGIKATFNLNTGLFSEIPRPDGYTHYFYHLTKSQALELYTSSGHELAVHTLTHPFLETLSPEEIAHEITEDRKNIEEMFGGVVRGMAYPFGTYDDRVVEIAKSCGIAYSRTTISTGCFDIPCDWLRLPATCHHNDPRLNELTDRFISSDGEAPSLFYLWGHTYEFRWNNNWEIIESFAAKIGGRNDIWYATNIEICDYVEAFRALRFSADGTKVYNPSACDVCFTADGKNVTAVSGVVTDIA